VIQYIVDRIEKNYAVCYDEKNQYTEIPLEKFGFPVRESMVILYDEQKDSYAFDKETTERMLEENRKKLRSLFDRK